MKKRCGYKEGCFERGTQFGHLESVICKNFAEGVCTVDNEEVYTYIQYFSKGKRGS